MVGYIASPAGNGHRGRQIERSAETIKKIADNTKLSRNDNAKEPNDKGSIKIERKRCRTYKSID